MLFSNARVSAWSAAATYLMVATAAALPSSKGYALQPVYQFSNNTWIENMAIRANGHILATDLDKGLVYDLDPNTNPVVPVIVATFPQNSLPTGATEVEPDIFYIGNTQGFASNLTVIPGTASVWKIDMNTYKKGSNATVSKYIDVPAATMLNGIVTVSSEAGIILVTDSVGGAIYSVNVHNHTVNLALDHPLLKPDPKGQPPFGVNGIRIRDSKLFFCNTNYGYLGTFPISPLGEITPNPTLITSSVPAADDFDIDSNGNVWLAENVQNTLVRVTPSGHIDVIAGGRNSTALLGPVSARFGRGAQKGTLYVSTDGLSFGAKGQRLTTAGKIVKIAVEGGDAWAKWI